MANEQQDRYGEYVARLLDLPPGQEREGMLDALRTVHLSGAPADPYDEARALVHLSDLLWLDAHQGPDLNDDPVAAMLGLVADSSYRLDPRAFRRARNHARLQPTDIATVLTKRGWTTTPSDIFTWEVRGSSSVPPALIRVLGEVLGADPDSLTTPENASASSETAIENQVVAAVSSPRFADIAKRFAQLQNMTQKMAVSALQSRMLATVHRGEHPDVDQMLASVEALVDALEDGDNT